MADVVIFSRAPPELKKYAPRHSSIIARMMPTKAAQCGAAKEVPLSSAYRLASPYSLYWLEADCILSPGNRKARSAPTAL